MIEYLEGLLEEKGQEQKVLELAEEMLKNTTNSPREVLAIQTAIMRARATSGQYDLAITPGEVALQLSKELEEWDYLGVACLFLGTSYGMLGKHELACSYLKEYLNHLSLLRKTVRYQSNVWYNLALFLLRLNRPAEASDAFAMAAITSLLLKSDRWEHGVRQGLVVQFLRTGEFDKIPRLLAACSYYLRHYADSNNKHSRLFHIESRVKFTWGTLRTARAVAIAEQGLFEASGDYRHMAALHMLIARIKWDVGEVDDALDHAVTARYYSRQSNRSDLENEATHFLYDAIAVAPDRASYVQEKLGNEEGCI